MSAILQDQHNNYAAQHAQRLRSKPDANQRRTAGQRESRGDLLKEGSKDSNPQGIVKQESKDVEAAKQHPDRPKRTWLSRVRKRFKWLYKKLGLKHLTPFIIITIYSIIGAAIFIGFERSNDLELKEAKVRQVMKARRELLVGIEEAYEDPAFEVPKRKTRLAQLLDYFEESVEFSVSNQTVWTFWNAVYYCGTLYTTIGYGNIFPLTVGGRLFTVFYALIGIPLVLSALNDLGKVLFLFILNCLNFWEDHVSKRLCWWRAAKQPAAAAKDSPGDGSEAATEAKLKTSAADDKMVRSVDSGVTSDVEDAEEEEDEKEIDEKIMSIPVPVALFVTLGWIFFCAGLFCIWESEWTYFTSVYFIFISFSTIGLGDVTPIHTDYMIGVFYFVIVGLSLVSMCINVIQHRLEELYMQLLMMVFQEYQKRLMEGGGDQVNATLGMMSAWNNNKAAKLLMPLLSNNKRQAVVQKFQEEAKAQGIVLPAALLDVDAKSGLPAILKISKEEKNEEKLGRDVESAIKRIEEKKLSEAAAPVVKRVLSDSSLQTEPMAVMTEAELREMENELNSLRAALNLVRLPAETQTDSVPTLSTEVRTDSVEHRDEDVQTDIPQSTSEMQTDGNADVSGGYDSQSQTEGVFTLEEQSQTEMHPVEDGAMQTLISLFASADAQNQTHIVKTWNNDAQTNLVETREEQSQTQVAPTVEGEAQTVVVNSKDQLQQTPVHETLDREAQSDANPTQEGTAQTDPGPTHSQLTQTELFALESQSVQTDSQSAAEAEVQTDPDLCPDVVHINSEWFTHPAQKHLRKAFRADRDRARKLRELVGEEPIPTELYYLRPKTIVINDETFACAQEASKSSSDSDLEWNPHDGMHAEKQKPVGKLKQMFEAGQVAVPKEEKPKAKRSASSLSRKGSSAV